MTGPNSSAMPATLVPVLVTADSTGAPTGAFLANNQSIPALAALTAQLTKLTLTQFNALVTAATLVPGAYYNVDGVLKQALTTSTYDSFSGASFGVADALQTDAGSATYTGPAHWAVDYTGVVWRYRHTNVPPFVGGRLVYNWLYSSDDPALWVNAGSSGGGNSWTKVTGQSLLDGTTGAAMQVTIVASGSGGTNIGPTIQGPGSNGTGVTTAINSAPPLFMIGMTMVNTYDIKQNVGSTITQNFATYDIAASVSTPGSQPTESRGGARTWSANGIYRRLSHPTPLNMMAYGLQTRPELAANDVAGGTFNIARVSLDFASGVDSAAFTPQEYIPGLVAGPGWKYYTTVKGNTCSNSATYTNDLTVTTTQNTTDAGVGIVTETTGAAIAGSDPFLGFLQEPATTHLLTIDNWLYGIGWAKSSDADGGGIAPFTANSASGKYECSSMQMTPFTNPTTIAMASGVAAITDSGNGFVTAGWKPGMGVWVWTAGGNYGPFKIAAAGVAAGTLTLTSSAGVPTFSGSACKLFRCPNASDQVLIIRNNGSLHRTTVSGAVVLPATAASFGIKDPVTFTLAAALPNDGIDSGWANTDNGVHIYYWTNETDFGFQAAVNWTFDIVYDKAGLRALGLDEVCPHGLYATCTQTSGNPSVKFGTGVGTTHDTLCSAWIKQLVAGTADFVFQQAGNTSSNKSFHNTSWSRLTTTAAAASGTTFPQINMNGSGAVHPSFAVLGMQMEQSAVATVGSAPVTSPLVSPRNGVAGARSAKRFTWAWGTVTAGVGVWKKNNFQFNVDFTPSQALLGIFQCICNVGTTTDGVFVFLSGASGDTWTLRKYVATVATDITATLAAVAGTTYSITARCDSTTGMTLTVNAASATPNTAAAGIADVALTATSAFDLGSPVSTGTGATAATAAAPFGALRKTPSATTLFG